MILCACGSRLRSDNKTGACSGCNVALLCDAAGEGWACDRLRIGSDSLCVGHQSQKKRDVEFAPIGSKQRSSTHCRYGHEWGATKACSGCNRIHQLAQRYNLTVEQFENMKAAQGGRCAVCREDLAPSTPHVDHNHACCPGEKSCGRCVRGLLCAGCNKGIGHLRDDPDLAFAAFIYLTNTDWHKMASL